MKFLITGFEPFGKYTTNTSWEAVCRLPEQLDDIAIIKKQLPVSFGRVGNTLQQYIEEVNPDVVLCIGQAVGRTSITPEKVAINWKASSVPDNDGEKPFGSKIYENEATAYFSTIPVEDIVSTLKEANIPSQVSYSAGVYVCNCTMYSLLKFLNQTNSSIKGGFIHIPCSCEQAVKEDNTNPTLPLDKIVKGLELIIKTTAKNYS